MRETCVRFLGQEDPLEEENGSLIPVFLPGKSHGQKSLAGYSPWGHKRVGGDLVTEDRCTIVSIHIQKDMGEIYNASRKRSMVIQENSGLEVEFCIFSLGLQDC